jgi:hypothetical protein
MAIDTLLVYCGVDGDPRTRWLTTSSSRSSKPMPT